MESLLRAIDAAALDIFVSFTPVDAPTIDAWRADTDVVGGFDIYEFISKNGKPVVIITKRNRPTATVDDANLTKALDVLYDFAKSHPCSFVVRNYPCTTTLRLAVFEWANSKPHIKNLRLIIGQTNEDVIFAQ